MSTRSTRTTHKNSEMGRNEEAAFSRTGHSLGEGKCSSRVDIPVPPELEEKLIGLAVLAGRPKAEFARMLLTKAIEGELAYLRSVGAIPGDGDGRNGG